MSTNIFSHVTPAAVPMSDRTHHKIRTNQSAQVNQHSITNTNVTSNSSSANPSHNVNVITEKTDSVPGIVGQTKVKDNESKDTDSKTPTSSNQKIVTST